MPRDPKNKPKKPRATHRKALQAAATPAAAGTIVLRTVREGLTRGEAAGILGVSVSKLRRLEKDGLLHPTGARGEVRGFDEDEVRALARRLAPAPGVPNQSGEHAAQAFALFDENVGVREVVKRLRITADEACALYADWLKCGEMGGPVLVPRDELAKVIAALEPHAKASLLGSWCGMPKDGAALLAWVLEALEFAAESERERQDNGPKYQAARDRIEELEAAMRRLQGA